METFELCLALAPLAVYLLLLGAINSARRPVVITSTRETAALGLALVGFVIVGPMQLFVPEDAATRFGPWVWLMMVSFYALCLTLWILVERVRLVIYNIRAEQLRPVLSEVALKLDSEARWAGNSLALPQLRVQLHLDDYRSMRNVSLVATDDDQSLAGWRRLELALREALRHLEVARNPRGMSLVTGGLLMLVLMFYEAIENPQALAQGLEDMLRL